MVLYKGYQIEITTHGSARQSSEPHYTEILIDGIGEIKLDFAAPIYAVDLAKAAVDLRVASRAEHLTLRVTK